MGNISRDVRKKGYILFKEGKVQKELQTKKRVHFKVKGETGEHSVIFDKERKKWKCDCYYWTLQQKTCSHIFACSLTIKKPP